MINKTIFSITLTCCLSASFIGCGSRTAVVPASGQVVLNGQPVADCAVSFEPTARNVLPASAGLTDANGNFSLMTVETSGRRRGAAPGEYTVRFFWRDPAMDGPNYDESKPVTPPYKIPLKYEQQGITFELPAKGKPDIVFDLVP